MTELAEQYQDPEEVVSHYMGDEQLKTQVKSAILEEKAVAKLLEQTNIKDVEMSYQQVLAAAAKSKPSKMRVPKKANKPAPNTLERGAPLCWCAFPFPDARNHLNE